MLREWVPLCDTLKSQIYFLFKGSNTIIRKGEELVISKMNDQDPGIYMCNASNGHPNDTTGYFEVIKYGM